MKINVHPKRELSWQILPGLCLSATITLVSHAQLPTAEDFSPGVGDKVYAMAVQADGRSLAGAAAAGSRLSGLEASKTKTSTTERK
jgi:hypothetical protein